MTIGVVVWLALAALFAAMFFAIAAVVSILGARDLRQLLRGADERQKGGDGPQQ